MNASIEAVLSGVVAIAAPDGFPLESRPPRGVVRFTFGNGEVVEAVWNKRDYEKAAAELEAKSA